MVPQSTDFRCERTLRKQYAPPRRGIKTVKIVLLSLAVVERGWEMLKSICVRGWLDYVLPDLGSGT